MRQCIKNSRIILLGLTLCFLNANAEELIYEITENPFILDVDHVKKPIRFSHSVSDGDVNVDAADGHHIEIRISDLRSKNDLEDGRAFLKVDSRTGSVKLDCRGEFRESDFECFVPSDTVLSLRASDGDIRIENISGDVNCSASDGDILLKNVSGRISAESSDGDIALFQEKKSSLPISISTNDGSIAVHLASDVDAKIAANVIDGKVNFNLSGTIKSTADHPHHSKESKKLKMPWLKQRTIKIGEQKNPQAIQLNTLDGDILISNRPKTTTQKSEK